MATPSGRLPRHPELPPLNIEDNSGPRLADYLEKPRLVRTGGRRPHKLESEVSVEQLIPGLAQLSMYYNQTFLSDCDFAGVCDSSNHRNPTSPLNSAHGNRFIDHWVIIDSKLIFLSIRSM